MDIDAVKRRRKELQDKINRNSSIWKPPIGKSKVRILPSKINPANPFIEIWWHWRIGNNSVICLKNNYGEKCPICEFASDLWKSDSKEDKETAKKLFANLRFYVPVAVRGAEQEGPKYWGIGQTVYDTLTTALEDSELGDFTDIASGRDVDIVVKAASETGKTYNSISAKFSYSNTVLHHDEVIIKKLLEEQKTVQELFPKPTFESCHELLEKWLNPTTEVVTDEEAATSEEGTTRHESHSSDVAPAESAGDDELSQRFAKLFKQKEKDS